jgi:hypothetical protein
VIRRLPVFLPALAMALLPACSSPQKQLSVEELATAIALIEAGEDERAYKMLDDYQVEDFDLPTQRDYNLMVARLADRIGKWSAAMKYYEAFTLQAGPADDAREAEMRLLDLGTELLDGERKVFFFFTDRSRGVTTLENLSATASFPRIRAEATARVAEHYFAKGRYRMAAPFYASLLSPDYAGLGWEDGASFRLAMCYVRLVDPDKLSGSTIRFAADQLAAYLRDFPGGLHRVEAEEWLLLCRSWMADYQLLVGDYYRRIGNLQGARHHYRLAAGMPSMGDESMVGEVPDARQVATARERLAGLPAEEVEPEPTP